MKELTSLVKEVNVDARKKGTFFDFAIIFPDARSPMFRMREIGSCCAGRKGADDGVTLLSKRFQIGDFIDIAITPPSMRSPGLGPRGPPPRRPRPY